VALAVVHVGCPPANQEASVDEPRRPSTLDFLQSEQSIVRTVLPDGSRAYIMGYNDLTDQVTTGSDGRPALRAGHSVMGLSRFLDARGTWQPDTQFPVPDGVTGLRGDPWLDTRRGCTDSGERFTAVHHHTMAASFL